MTLIDPTTEVWNHSRSAGTERVLLLAIAKHADPDGYAWPGLKRLTAMVNVGERATQAALAKLILAGELAVLRGRGRGHASLYRVLLGQPADAGQREVMLAWLRTKMTPYLADLYAKVNDASPSADEGKVQQASPSEGEKVQRRVLEKVQPASGSQGAYRNELPVGTEIPPTAAHEPERWNAGHMVKRYLDTLPCRPPGREVGQLAKLIGEMSREGIEEWAVTDALEEYRQRDLHPSVLPSLVAVRLRGGSPRRRQGTDWRAIAAQLEAAEQEPPPLRAIGGRG